MELARLRHVAPLLVDDAGHHERAGVLRVDLERLADLGVGLRLAGEEPPEAVDTRLDPVREVL